MKMFSHVRNFSYFKERSAQRVRGEIILPRKWGNLKLL